MLDFPNGLNQVCVRNRAELAEVKYFSESLSDGKAA
jgi:hypothetical protein